jgi:hypothetical protein
MGSKKPPGRPVGYSPVSDQPLKIWQAKVYLTCDQKSWLDGQKNKSEAIRKLIQAEIDSHDNQIPSD